MTEARVKLLTLYVGEGGKKGLLSEIDSGGGGGNTALYRGVTELLPAGSGGGAEHFGQ